MLASKILVYFLALLAVVSLGFALRAFFRSSAVHQRIGVMWILLTAGFALLTADIHMMNVTLLLPNRAKPFMLINVLGISGFLCFVLLPIWMFVMQTLSVKEHRQKTAQRVETLTEQEGVWPPPPNLKR